MARIDTLPEYLRPLMEGVTVRTTYCAVCGRTYPLNQHHVVRRGAGKMYRGGVEVEKPTVTLCGFGNNLHDDDGRAYTPIMKLFGRAAIPTTTYEGVKSIIERKMKAGEISQPWEIFENLLGETYGARGRKAD